MIYFWNYSFVIKSSELDSTHVINLCSLPMADLIKTINDGDEVPDFSEVSDVEVEVPSIVQTTEYLL